MQTKSNKKNESAAQPLPKAANPDEHAKSTDTDASANGIKMSEGNTQKIKMENTNTGINMGDHSENILKSKGKETPSVTFPEHIRYDSVFSPTSIDRVPVNKSAPVNYSAAGLKKETTLHLVPKGSSHPSKKDQVPASLDTLTIQNGDGTVNITGSSQSTVGIQYEIIAVHGKKEVIGRSSPFVVTSFPYRVFRKKGEQYTGKLGFSYDLVVSADSYNDPSSAEEAFSKEDSQMENALGRTNIMEEISAQPVLCTGLFSPSNPDQLGFQEVVQTDPAPITKDNLFDSNTISVDQYGPTANLIKKKMVKEYNKTNFLKTTESKLTQFQYIYFGEDVAGINVTDKVQIPESFYFITHKLILVPSGDSFKFKYRVETSSKSGDGYSQETASEVSF